MTDFQKLQNKVDRICGRLKSIEDKYYHWKHYFEIKKKRVDGRLADRERLDKGIAHIRRLLKNLSIKQVKGTGFSKDKRSHILRLAYNDIRRLRLLLRSKNLIGRVTRKKDGELFNFTNAEKKKLTRLLKR